MTSSVPTVRVPMLVGKRFFLHLAQRIDRLSLAQEKQRKIPTQNTLQ